MVQVWRDEGREFQILGAATQKLREPVVASNSVTASWKAALYVSFTFINLFIDKRQKYHFYTPETIDALKRVHSIKSLRVTFTNGLSVALHVQQLTTSNAQLLYELKLLRADGLCDAAIQAVFRSVALARFLCASPAWLGLCRSPGQLSLLIIQ